MIVISKDGTDIKRLISWSSKPVRGSLTRDHDGNHSSWVPGGHKVVMNLAPLVAHSKSLESLVEGLINIGDKPSAPMKWRLVMLDADKPEEMEIELYAAGSGHPSVRKGGRFVLTDAYTKESGWFGEDLVKGASPLRLIDIQRSLEVWLLQMPTVRPVALEEKGGAASNMGKANSNSKEREPDTTKKRQLNAWRCDMHPTWSRDFQWIAFNGRPQHGLRQVS